MANTTSTRREFLIKSGVFAALRSAPAFATEHPVDCGHNPFRVLAQMESASGPFSPSFLWGAATSAYQIEGAARQDGKGPSTWDEFARQPGVIADGKNGDIACDFYHRYAEDIATMKALGFRAFRFSVSWPRIMPEGTGAVNQRGLDFYQRLVDALLAADIAPMLTLFHWDTPAALARRGAWTRRETASWFADYSAVLAAKLGDRVRYWFTINEPRSFVGGGYVTGVQAPGARLSRAEYMRAAHIVLLAHGRAVQAIRAHCKNPPQVSCPNDFSPALPETPSTNDVAAAYRATFSSPGRHFFAGSWWNENSWWFDPVYAGKYPPAAIQALAGDAPKLQAGDMETICQPLDFIAANLYAGRFVHAEGGDPNHATEMALPPGFPITSSINWPLTPEVMYWGPKWLHERYNMPVFITENGCSCPNWILQDGRVPDPQRADFINRYLEALGAAANEGIPLLGYLHWSLLDNFEWQEGYTRRWGLIFVDFSTQKRVMKDSAARYADIIRANGTHSSARVRAEHEQLSLS